MRMIDILIAFGAGLIVGAFIGIALIALATAAGKADEEAGYK